ncbi:MAG: lactate utilization protein [Acidobacteria bacterium]|nr:lactate utilization protein [Acidobacteriota bacterium]
MTPAERQQMRDLLRAALKKAVLPGATPDPPGGYRRTDPAAPDLAPRFIAELTTVGGCVHEPASPDATTIARLIATIAAEALVKRALIWDDGWLPVPGLAAAIEAAEFTIDRQQTDDLSSEARRAELSTATIGITGAEAALSDTGSVVLVSGPGRGRLASLLPPVHIALVERAKILRSLPDLLLERPELATSGSNLVCITGPSRTADIEHTLSRGVHGPREVHVILLPSAY